MPQAIKIQSAKIFHIFHRLSKLFAPLSFKPSKEIAISHLSLSLLLSHFLTLSHILSLTLSLLHSVTLYNPHSHTLTHTDLHALDRRMHFLWEAEVFSASLDLFAKNKIMIEDQLWPNAGSLSRLHRSFKWMTWEGIWNHKLGLLVNYRQSPLT